jgi:hypothetical protein
MSGMRHPSEARQGQVAVAAFAARPRRASALGAIRPVSESATMSGMRHPSEARQGQVAVAAFAARPRRAGAEGAIRPASERK